MIKPSIMLKASGVEPLGSLSCHVSGHRISPRGERQASLQVLSAGLRSAARSEPAVGRRAYRPLGLGAGINGPTGHRFPQVLSLLLTPSQRRPGFGDLL